MDVDVQINTQTHLKDELTKEEKNTDTQDLQRIWMVSNQICVRDDLAKEKVAKQKKSSDGQRSTHWYETSTHQCDFWNSQNNLLQCVCAQSEEFQHHHNTKDALHRCCIHLGECENDTTYQLIFLTTQPKNEESKITTCSIHEAWNDERQTPQLSTRPGQREPNQRNRRNAQTIATKFGETELKPPLQGYLERRNTKLVHFIFFFKWPSTSSWNPHSWVSNWQENTNTVIRQMCSGCWKLR